MRHVTTVLWLNAAMVCAQHVHVQVSHSPPDQWRLFILDFDAGEFDPADAPLLVAHAAFAFIPPNSFTNVTGPPGSALWTLPAVENPALLFLGLGTSGIAQGTFANNEISLRLHSLSGPGHFIVYKVDPLGAPIVHMNSRDGIDPVVDSIALGAGRHSHVNWAFSAPGIYRLGFSASGRLHNGQSSSSATVIYMFIVEDVPWRPRLSIARDTAPANLLLSVHSEAGRHCRIEATRGFDRWETVTNFTPASAVTTITLPGTPHPYLYRASIRPP